MPNKNTTINIFQMSWPGSEEVPVIEEWEKFKTDKGFATDKEATDWLNNNGWEYFIGTHDEYDDLSSTVKFYFAQDDKTEQVDYQDFIKKDNIVNGKVVITFEKNVVGSYPNAILKNEQDWREWKVKEQAEFDKRNEELKKETLAQDNIFLSSAKVAQQVLLKLIAQQINGNQETISMNLSKISENNETVLRKVLSGNSTPADVAILGLNVRYRAYNSTLHTNNADLEAYALALSTLKVEEMTQMYDDVINSSMSVGDAFQKEMKAKLPTTKEVQLGKELHETYVIDTIGQDNYNKFLDIFKELDLTTHLEPFTKLKLAPKAPTDTSGIV